MLSPNLILLPSHLEITTILYFVFIFNMQLKKLRTYLGIYKEYVNLFLEF